VYDVFCESGDVFVFRIGVEKDIVYVDEADDGVDGVVV